MTLLLQTHRDFHEFFYFYTSGRTTSSYLSVLGDSVRKKSFRFWRYNRFWLLFSFRWGCAGGFLWAFPFLFFSVPLYAGAQFMYLIFSILNPHLFKKKVWLFTSNTQIASTLQFYTNFDVLFVQVTNTYKGRKKIKVLKIYNTKKKNFIIHKYSIYNIYLEQRNFGDDTYFMTKIRLIVCHILR